MGDAVLLRALQDALVEATSKTRVATQVGGFVTLITAEDPLTYFNYAVPTSPPTPGDCQALIAHFIAASRSPRLEYFADLWPQVGPMLEQHGFSVERTAPIMALRREEYAGNHTKARPAAPSDACAMRTVSGIAFGMESDPSSDAQTAQSLSDGSLLGAVSESGGVVACGMAIGTARVREIAGIATLPEFRRQGHARSVICCLLDQFFGSGGEVAWLTPGDDGAERLYESLGFRTVGTQVNYVFPD